MEGILSGGISIIRPIGFGRNKESNFAVTAMATSTYAKITTAQIGPVSAVVNAKITVSLAEQGMKLIKTEARRRSRLLSIILVA